MTLQVIHETSEEIDITSRPSQFVEYYTIGHHYKLTCIDGVTFDFEIFVPIEKSLQEELSKIFNQEVE